MSGKAIRETLAALGVIASMVFVGLEIRQNTVAVRGTTHQELVNASLSTLQQLAGDPVLASIIFRVNAIERGDGEWTDLNGVEGVQYFSYTRAMWRNQENAFYQNQLGLLTGEEWEAYSYVMCTELATNQTTLALHRAALTPTFVAFVDACSG
jgi:hypothetical protein